MVRARARGDCIHSVVDSATDFIGGTGSDWFGGERSTFNQVHFVSGGGFDNLHMRLQTEPNARGNAFLVPPSYSNLERLAS